MNNRSQNNRLCDKIVFSFKNTENQLLFDDNNISLQPKHMNNRSLNFSKNMQSENKFVFDDTIFPFQRKQNFPFTKLFKKQSENKFVFDDSIFPFQRKQNFPFTKLFKKQSENELVFDDNNIFLSTKTT